MNDQYDQAVKLLDTWIAEARFTEEVTGFVRGLQGAGSAYGEILAEQGEPAAKAYIRQRYGLVRRHRAARGIALVACGMCELLRSGQSGPVHVIGNLAGLSYPQPFALCNRAQMICMTNPHLPGDTNRRPAGHEIFYPTRGQLGLRRVTLLVDPTDPHHNELGLILRGRAPTDNDAAFTVVRFNLAGDVFVDKFMPGFAPDEPLDATLGIIDWKDAWNNYRVGQADDDEKIGFPGATDFIARNLKGLARYFTSLAALTPVSARG